MSWVAHVGFGIKRDWRMSGALFDRGSAGQSGVWALAKRSRSEMALQAFEIAKNAPGNGAPVSRPPAGLENGFHGSSPQAMGRMLAGRGRRRDSISGVEFFALDCSQPVEKPRIGRRNPIRFQAHFLGPAWYGFGMAWRKLRPETGPGQPSAGRLETRETRAPWLKTQRRSKSDFSSFQKSSSST